MLKPMHFSTALRRVNGSFLAVMLLVGLICTPLAFGQQDAAQDRPASPAVERYLAPAQTARQDATRARDVEERVPVEQLDSEQTKAIFEVLSTLYSQRGRDANLAFQYQGGTNTLTLRGGKEEVETATKVISQLEKLLAPAEKQVKVFQLQNASANALAQSIAVLFDDGRRIRFSVDSRANAVIVMGAEEDLAVVEALISRLDAAAHKDASELRQPQIFGLKNSPAEKVANTIREVFKAEKNESVRSIEVTVLPPQNALVVRARSDVLKEVQQLIERLDQPSSGRADGAASPTLQVRIIWLASGESSDESGKLPPNMESVAQELEKLGISNLHTVGQAVVKSLPEQQFALTVRSSLQEKPVELRVQGSIEMESEEPMVQLQLQGNINEPSRQQGGYGSAQQSLVNVNSTIQAPMGHFVVLGVTPTDLAPDAKLTSIFVLQITGQ
ncbi:MAG: secretin N-terminal domain-containing protein [Pirellulales bacterium]